jgi:ferredoxin-NADP reductase
VQLVGVRDLAPAVRAFTWRCVDGSPLVYVAGQWVNFYVPSGPAGDVLRRAYSIASAPHAECPDRFEIAVTRVREGYASRVLHDLAPGATLSIDGAHGFFTREHATREPALFVATGTGVCPLRAMIEDELRAASGPRIELLVGHRAERDVLYREDFQRWADEHPRFTWRATLSRPEGAWTGARGYVQEHLRNVALPNGTHVYVCGLQKMIKEVRRVLREERGLDRRLIHSERYD